MTKNNFEDNKTPRISFSTSIDGALTGISDNLDYKVFYVHEPLNYNNLIIKRITNEEVPDQSLTNEVWVLNPCKLKTIGKIRVSGTESQVYKYKYGEVTLRHTNGIIYIYIRNRRIMILRFLIKHIL